MKSSRLAFLVLVASILVLVPAQTAKTAPPTSPPDPTCSPGPSDCSAWHTQDVTVTWSGPPAGVNTSGCSPVTISTDTSGAPVSCTWSNGDGSRTTTAVVRRDGTQPSATAHADRDPDVNGWYNHPLTVTFTGSDATSGIASCSPATTYRGPDSSDARVGGECKDQAGNWSNPWYGFRYDATPPSLKRVKVELGNKSASLAWTASNDAVRIEVVRQPGLQGTTASTIYTGDGRSFTDRRIKAGVKYRYTVTAFDQAGNAAAKALLAEPGHSVATAVPSKPVEKSTPSRATLLGPAEGAHLALPPQLTWRPVSGATYYNVQLFRDGHKILSSWPSGTSLGLQRSWTYAGKRYALTQGRYRWYVWPGLGRRSANRYGKLIGTRSFIVTS